MFSMSKTYGMAGWRLGFVLGNAEIVERVNLLQDHARAGSSPPSRRRGSRRSRAPGFRAGTGRPVRGAARPRRRSASEHPSDRPSPKASMWVELPDGVTVERLLAEARVALAPGEGFGASGAGWARLSLAVTDEQLERGLERLVLPSPRRSRRRGRPLRRPRRGPSRRCGRVRRRSAIRRLTENDPLGGRVMRTPRKTTTPFRLITTFQRRPLRFWSTSNSVSTRPSSCLALSFQFAPEPEQTPVRVTPGLSLAGATRECHADRQKRCEDCELAHFLPPGLRGGR